MLVMKYKGAVLQDQVALAEVKKVFSNQQHPCVVVVSALKGVMPRLRRLYALSLKKGAGFEEEFREFVNLHASLAADLLSGKDLEEYLADLRLQTEDLYNILNHVAVLRDRSLCMKDYILAKGDILASLLFSKLFAAGWKDSRSFILTDGNFGAPEILWEDSCLAATREFAGLQGLMVVPGYCGRTQSGDTISLGRVGLSLTAAVLEAAFCQVKVA